MVPSGRRPPPPPPSPLSPTSPVQKANQEPCPPPLPKRHPKDEPDVKTEDEYEQPVQAKDYEPMAAPNPVNIPSQNKKGFAAPKSNIISNLEMALKNRKERQGEINKSENSPKSWNPFQIEQKTTTYNKPPVPANKNTDKERKISDPKKPHLTLPEKTRRLTDGDAVVPSMPTHDDVYEEPSGPPPRNPPNNQRQQHSREEDTDDSWDEDWDESGGQDPKKEDDGEVYEIPEGANEDYVPVEDGKPPPLPKERHPPAPHVTNNKKEMPPATPLKPVIANFLKPLPQKDQNKKSPQVNKPAPPEKPKKQSVPDGPQLPPRVQEKRNSRSDDNSSAGSTSSGSVSMHQETAQTNGNQDLRSQSKVRVLPHVPMPGITKIPEPKAPDPCDEIYDDAVTEYLGTYDWFHPKVDRKEAEKRIFHLRENGSFLVRESGSGKDGGTHPYTLVVLYNSKPYNLQLRERSDKRFAIGKHKPDEVSFATVPELITHHKSNNIKLEDGTVMLKNTPQKR